MIEQPTELPTLRPATLDALAKAVTQVRGEGHRVRIEGSASSPLTQFADDPRPIQTISTLRLNKLVEHAVADMTVIVQAGMTLEALQRQLAWRNQWLPVDPPVIGAPPASTAVRTPGARTIGGLIATNSLGPLRFGSGDWRLLIMGTRWVDAKGTLIKGGGRTVKNVAGYSTPRMMIGSCGSLGVIAEVTLRTYARPADEQSVLFYCADAPRAEALLAAIAASPTSPAYLQLIGNRTFAANPLQLPAPDAGMMLVAGFLGREEVCAAQIQTVRDLPAAQGMESIPLGAAPSGRLRLWMTTEPAPEEGANFRLFAKSSQSAGIVQEIEGSAPGAWVISEAGSGIVRGAVSGQGKDALRAIATRIQAGLLWTRGPKQAGEDALTVRLKGAIDPEKVFGEPPGLM